MTLREKLIVLRDKAGITQMALAHQLGVSRQAVTRWESGVSHTIEEASKYFRIGENKLRRLAEENKDAGWLIMNGNRIQIKRRQFEKIIDKLDAI